MPGGLAEVSGAGGTVLDGATGGVVSPAGRAQPVSRRKIRRWKAALLGCMGSAATISFLLYFTILLDQGGSGMPGFSVLLQKNYNVEDRLQLGELLELIVLVKSSHG